MLFQGSGSEVPPAAGAGSSPQRLLLMGVSLFRFVLGLIRG